MSRRPGPTALVALAHLLPALLTAAGCAAPRAPAPAPSVDRGALEAKVERAERSIRDRFLSPEGLLVYRQSVDSPPDLSRGPYGNLSDTACWGGYYLGAEALRFAATRSPDSLAVLDRALSGLELLDRVTGVPGLFARTADRGLTDQEFRERRGDWRETEVPGTWYRGGVSKDQYAGLLFGLGCVLRHARSGELGSRAGRLLISLADHLDAGGVSIRDVDGEVTTHGNLSDRYLGIPIAANASIALAAFALSAEAGGPVWHLARYRDLVNRGYARSASFAKVSVLGKANRDNDHMVTAGLYHLYWLERDPETRELYRRGLARVAFGVRGEQNAYLLGLHMACSGPDEGMLGEAWDALARLPAVQMSAPLDLRGEVDGVVPIEQRHATAFVWRSDPYTLTRDLEGTRPRVEYAPIDLVLAYWLLRAHGLE